MSRQWKVLISAPYIQPVIDRFRPELEAEGIEIILPPVNERLSEEQLLQWVGDVDGVICGDDRFTARVLDVAPKLKVISKWGTGIDSIDQAACRERGVRVCNTPGAFNEPVADTVMSFVLSFARKTHLLDAEMRRDTWSKAPCRALHECTLGVIGVGEVGKTVVRRTAGFGMPVLGNDVVEMPADFLDLTGIRMVSKEDLLAQADFVSVNCNLNDTSHHLMNDAAFDRMKVTAVLINTARGPIVDEPALIQALRSGRIAGAALDVFEEEPLPEDSPLKEMPNVLLAPHNSNSSPTAWERVHENTIHNLLNVLKGETD